MNKWAQNPVQMEAIQWAYSEASTTYFSDLGPPELASRQEINRAVGVCIDFSAYAPMLDKFEHLSRSYSSDRYSVCGKRLLAIAAMNAELPPFNNGEHNSENASTVS